MDERKHRESHWLTQTRMNADHALHWIDPTHPWHRTGCILPQHNTHWHEKLEWCRGRATGFDEMQLQLLIKELLISIASSSKPSGKETTKNVSQYMPLQSRLLSSFNQCFQFPVLIFDLSLHTLDEWVKLSASAIRCTIEPCGKGFVFVTWQWNTGATSWKSIRQRYRSWTYDRYFSWQKYWKQPLKMKCSRATSTTR